MSVCSSFLELGSFIVVGGFFYAAGPNTGLLAYCTRNLAWVFGGKMEKNAIFPWSSSQRVHKSFSPQHIRVQIPWIPKSGCAFGCSASSTDVHQCLLIHPEDGSSIPNCCSLEQLLHRWDWGARTINKINPAQLAGSGSQLAKHSRTQPDADMQWVPEEF